MDIVTTYYLIIFKQVEEIQPNLFKLLLLAQISTPYQYCIVQGSEKRFRSCMSVKHLVCIFSRLIHHLISYRIIFLYISWFINTGSKFKFIKKLQTRLIQVIYFINGYDNFPIYKEWEYFSIYREFRTRLVQGLCMYMYSSSLQCITQLQLHQETNFYIFGSCTSQLQLH